jgi:lipopolysaccharide/colanic/teichoic acid biosynthesis glycosyltransferase
MLAEPSRPPAHPLPLRSGLPRAVELPLAALGLIVASPLLALGALAVVASSPGPAWFRQERVGRGGRPFTLYKLRSMRVDAGGPSVTSQADVRVTAAGRWLRRSKLDELPQLWNVVRGDMALVGPRPEVPRFVDLADPQWQRVLEARPGITDPLTLKLRDEEKLMPDGETDPERFYLQTLQPFKLRGYLEYLERRSWWSDVEVLFATVTSVVRPAPPPDRDEILRRGRL